MILSVITMSQALSVLLEISVFFSEKIDTGQI